jgi:hypothetical protein
MAYLTQEAYDRKREYAARRMEDNREIETLTEEQHDALSKVCEDRHRLHGHGMSEAIYCTEHPNNRDWYEIIDDPYTGERGAINTVLEEARLPIIENLELPDCPDDQWREYQTVEEAGEELEVEREDGEDDDDYESKVSDAHYQYGVSKCHDIAESINAKIEDYLRSIDDEHGTHYCPSGATRIF